MAQIIQNGVVNPVVPNAYINIVQPSNGLITAAPTNLLGIVGVGSWGPVNAASLIGGNSQAQLTYGNVTVREYDIATAVAVSVQNGVTNMRCVRVTDGTDTAAQVVLAATTTRETATFSGTATPADIVTLTFTPSAGPVISVPYTVGGTDTLTTIVAAILVLLKANASLTAAGFTFSSSGLVITYNTPPGTPTWTYSQTVSGSATEVVTLAAGSPASVTQLTLISKYTGSLANQSAYQIATGSAASTFKLILTLPGYQPEVFDNLSGVGNLFWVNAANAINNGQSGVRGHSNLMVATAGASTAAPVTGNVTNLAGGTDGAAGVVATQLVGTDGTSRTGLYVLRGLGCSVVNIVDLATTTQWATVAAFAVSEGVFCGDATAVGDTITNAVTELATAGVDTPWFKALLGDWCYWQDNYNGVTRLLSPMTFWSALRAATVPQNSTLNRPVQGLVGTQKSASNEVYSTADLQALGTGRLDVIANPSPGGPYFSPQFGRNCSSNAAIRGENYTMITDFIVSSIGPNAGQIVGQLQNPTQRRQAKAVFDAFFASLAITQPDGSPPIIGNADGTQPWSVTISDQNNPPNNVEAGIESVAIQVQYQSVIEFLIVNVQGGQTVNITTQTQAVGSQPNG